MYVAAVKPRVTSKAAIDIGPRQKRLPWTAQTSSLLVYGLISFSVTMAAADAEQPREILLILLGNASALWIAHAFADATVHDTSTAKGLGHAAPMLAVAAPSAAVLLLAWGNGWSGDDAVIVAEVVNLLVLVALQLLHARQRRFRPGELALTALLDALAAAVVVGIIALVK